MADSHSNSIRSERAGSSLVLESAEVILSPYVLELRVALEGVNDTLSFDGVGALNVIMVREE